MTQIREIRAEAEWVSPSNLAIVKYWGKKNIQEPLNPSISFTLRQAVTRTRIKAEPAVEGGFTFSLNGKVKESFNDKIEAFMLHARRHLPFIRKHHLYIESSNTFPHSSGIASSASSMSALALGLIELHNLSLGKEDTQPDRMMASGLARLGSGSAARSVYGGWTLWGRFEGLKGSSDMYAIPIEEVADDFKTIRNAILIIDPAKKKVSSSEGHSLMDFHPYRDARIGQAKDHTERLLGILKDGDWDEFFEIAENEALSLHGLMMSSTPSYTLLHPNTISALALIREARAGGLTIGFSMDAGPNVHLLYPASEEEKVRSFIEKELSALCHEQKLIYDEIGPGPERNIDEI